MNGKLSDWDHVVWAAEQNLRLAHDHETKCHERANAAVHEAKRAAVEAARAAEFAAGRADALRNAVQLRVEAEQDLAKAYRQDPRRQETYGAQAPKAKLEVVPGTKE